MMRLRIGKFSASAGVPIANSLTIRPCGGDACGERAVARRVDDVEAGADDRDRAARRRPSAPSCAAPSTPSARPETTTQPAWLRCAAKARAFSSPCGVGLRLPTIAIAGACSSSIRPRT